MHKTLKVNIVGASGYVGAELIRLVHSHPLFVLNKLYAHTKAGQYVGDLFPNFEFVLPDTVLADTNDGEVSQCDILFLALPHTQSQAFVNELPENGPLVVDLSADFRFEDPSTYEQWYKTSHLAKNMQHLFEYGLVEFHREALRTSRYIAAPGCYPTAAILATKPLIDAGFNSGTSVIVDAASGVSGAGASPSDTTMYTNVESNFKAYGVINHRHTPEMAKELGVDVLFTPHLVPMTRGIVATCYIKCDRRVDENDLVDIYEKQYSTDPFISISQTPPTTKQVAGTNNAIVSAFYDERTQHIVAISAIDNLVKGAAGQAVQAANIALGFEETVGLTFTALYP